MHISCVSPPSPYHIKCVSEDYATKLFRSIVLRENQNVASVLLLYKGVEKEKFVMGVLKIHQDLPSFIDRDVKENMVINKTWFHIKGLSLRDIGGRLTWAMEVVSLDGEDLGVATFGNTPSRERDFNLIATEIERDGVYGPVFWKRLPSQQPGQQGFVMLCDAPITKPGDANYKNVF